MGIKKFDDLNEALIEIRALEIIIEREKSARENAEKLLEDKASHLFRMNSRLQEQFAEASKSNLEIDYLLKITKLEEESSNNKDLIQNFLKISSNHLWSEASFAFYCDNESQKLIPVTACLLGTHKDQQQKDESRFLSENFEFMEIHFNSTRPLRYSKFSQEIVKINDQYAHLNHSYLCPLEVDNEEKFLIWFTFSNAIELDEMTIELVDRGVDQLKNILQKQKSKTQLLDNYKKLQEVKSQLIQSEKMASIGTISAGIAHEINNPLSFLLTNSEVLKEYLNTIIDYILKLESHKCDENEIKSIKKNIDYILTDTPMLMKESLEGIHRIREIINGLRTFSRADDGELKDFDITVCIESSLRLVSNELKHKCRINKNLKSTSLIKGSEGQIIQVLTNLLVNSAQAIEDYGVIEINSSDVGTDVVVTIRDSGKGISKENLAHLFTPFFTTKLAGQGTGLGLSISYGIIQRHKGSIEVESCVGVGTAFHITIPAIERKE